MNPPPSSNSPSVTRLVSAYASIYLVWGSTYLAIRFALETLPPFMMAGARFLIAGSLVYGYLRLRGAEEATRPQWLAAGVVGALMLVGGNGLVCWAEQYVPSGLTALIIGTVPLWIVLLDWVIFRGRRPNVFVVLGLIGGLAGIYVLVGSTRLAGDRVDPWGAGALLAACFFWATGSLLSRALPRAPSPFLATAIQMLVGGALFMAIATAAGEWARVDLATVSLKSVAAVAFLIVFGSMVALTAYIWLLQVSPPARVATYAYVNPVVAVILGALLADEPVSPRAMVAAAVIIASVVLISTGKR